MLLKSIVYCLYVCSCFCQSPKIGDNLYSLLATADTNFKNKPLTISHWPEGQGVRLIPADIKDSKPNYAILLTSDALLFGALQGNYVWLDTDGDSVLDMKTQAFWMPYWIIKRKSLMSEKDHLVIDWFDQSYEQMLQANDGSLSRELVKQYDQFRSDYSIANRSLFYLYDSYQGLITTANEQGVQAPSELCLLILNKLFDETYRLYGRVPAVVYIYKGEALLSAGKVDEARLHFKESLKIYPNSIPILVYDFKLETDKEEQKRKLKELKSKYSKHWMVKTL